MNRNAQPAQAGQPAGANAPHGANKRSRKAGIMQWGAVALLFSVAVLVVFLVAFVIFGDKGSNQQQHVKKDRMQAVFLNGGQVYFGNITDLGKDSLRMSNIYYLRVNQTVQPNQQQSTNNSNDISLVKLGCELHGPEDAMVINQSQVIFWENLKTDGQVAEAVKKYKEQNPGEQQCNTASNQTNTNSNTGNTSNTNSNGSNSNTGSNNNR